MEWMYDMTDMTIMAMSQCLDLQSFPSHLWTVRHEPQQIAGAGLVLASEELGVMLPSGRLR